MKSLRVSTVWNLHGTTLQTKKAPGEFGGFLFVSLLSLGFALAASGEGAEAENGKGHRCWFGNRLDVCRGAKQQLVTAVARIGAVELAEDAGEVVLTGWDGRAYEVKVSGGHAHGDVIDAIGDGVVCANH